METVVRGLNSARLFFTNNTRFNQLNIIYYRQTSYADDWCFFFNTKDRAKKADDCGRKPMALMNDINSKCLISTYPGLKHHDLIN